METKTDDSSLQGQFFTDGFSAPYRLDRNCFSGGLRLFVREDIPCNLLTIEEKPVESFYAELNLRNSKWLVNWSYNPHKNSIGNGLDRVSESLNFLFSDYRCTSQLSKYLCTRDRAVWFPFDDWLWISWEKVLRNISLKQIIGHKKFFLMRK